MNNASIIRFEEIDFIIPLIEKLEYRLGVLWMLVNIPKTMELDIMSVRFYFSDDAELEFIYPTNERKLSGTLKSEELSKYIYFKTRELTTTSITNNSTANLN